MLVACLVTTHHWHEGCGTLATLGPPQVLASFRLRASHSSRREAKLHSFSALPTGPDVLRLRRAHRAKRLKGINTIRFIAGSIQSRKSTSQYRDTEAYRKSETSPSIKNPDFASLVKGSNLLRTA